MNNLKEACKIYLYSNNKSGSNKASSYMRALDLLNIILKGNHNIPVNITDIWNITSPELIYNLYQYALKYQKSDGSDFLRSDLPESYGRNGYYSAALRSLGEFLVDVKYENDLLPKFEQLEDGTEVAQAIENANIPEESLLFEETYSHIEGKDAFKRIKTRMNQNVFRKLILKIYNNQCCVTELDVPQLLVASHIKPWAKDKINRLNPSNGLCLNSLHDKAFDAGLITLDENLKIVVSKELKEHYTKDAVQKYFQPYDGRNITKPKQFVPDVDLLKYHREQIFIGV